MRAAAAESSLPPFLLREQRLRDRHNPINLPDPQSRQSHQSAAIEQTAFAFILPHRTRPLSVLVILAGDSPRDWVTTRHSAETENWRLGLDSEGVTGCLTCCRVPGTIRLHCWVVSWPWSVRRV
jgi:hypothetical protein